MKKQRKAGKRKVDLSLEDCVNGAISYLQTELEEAVEGFCNKAFSMILDDIQEVASGKMRLQQESKPKKKKAPAKKKRK